MADPSTPRSRPRRTTLQRLVIGVNSILVAGFLVAAAGLAYAYDKYASIPRVAIGDALSPSQADDGEPAAENFLVVGVDSAAGLDPDDPVAATRGGVGGIRSDTMMLLRVEPSTTQASLLSIPRDLYVPIGDGGRRNRINAAVELGGPELLVETISGTLGVEVNHYVQVDFGGFSELVDALDGVPMHFRHPARDRRSGLHVPEAGCVTLDAANALGFVRSRAFQERVDGVWRTDPTGDLGRIDRQQQFIVAALGRAFDRGVRNPVRLDRLIDAGIGALTLDDVLDADDLVGLAQRFRDFDPSSLEVHSLPVDAEEIGGAAVLRLRAVEAQPVLDLFRGVSPGSLDERAVRVLVRNGTGEPGQAAAAASALRERGFTIEGAGDASRPGGNVTEIRHPPTMRAHARLLGRWVAGSIHVVEDESSTTVTLVTGASWRGVRTAPRPAPITTTMSPQAGAADTPDHEEASAPDGDPAASEADETDGPEQQPVCG